MSLLDYSRVFLDRHVFDDSGNPLDWVKDFIIDKADVCAGDYKHIYLLGSIASLNWREDSDIDVGIIYQDGFDTEMVFNCFIEKGISTNTGGSSIVLPGTTHEVHFFMMQESEFSQSNYDGVYDLLSSKWIKNYAEHTVMDIEQAKSVMPQINSFVYALDFLLDTLEYDRKDLVSVKNTLDDLESSEETDKHETYQKLYDDLLNKFKESLRRLYDMVQKIKEDRHKNFAESGETGKHSTANILWKFLEKADWFKRADEYLGVCKQLFDKPEVEG